MNDGHKKLRQIISEVTKPGVQIDAIVRKSWSELVKSPALLAEITRPWIEQTIRATVWGIRHGDRTRIQQQSLGRGSAEIEMCAATNLRGWLDGYVLRSGKLLGDATADDLLAESGYNRAEAWGHERVAILYEQLAEIVKPKKRLRQCVKDGEIDRIWQNIEEQPKVGAA
jgi:hypothetical protein